MNTKKKKIMSKKYDKKNVFKSRRAKIKMSDLCERVLFQRILASHYYSYTSHYFDIILGDTKYVT